MEKLALLLAAVVAFTFAPTAAAAAADDTPRLQREGRYLVDQHGRIVIVHGLNLVWKHEPYVPPDSPRASPRPTRNGWRARLQRRADRHAVGRRDPERPRGRRRGVLRRWQRVIDLLADKGIWMQFDFHQDMWHETYGGEGVPDWAAKRPVPYTLTRRSAALPDVLHARAGHRLRQLLGEQERPAGRLGGGLEAVAQHYKDQPYSMGYDLINEPWAGREWPTCLITGLRADLPRELQPATTGRCARIRRSTRTNIVWYESQQLAGGLNCDTFGRSGRGQPRLLLAQLLPLRLLRVPGHPDGRHRAARSTPQTAQPRDSSRPRR